MGERFLGKRKSKLKKASQPKVSIVMGSQSDWRVMKNAVQALEKFDLSYEKKIISAHRTPKEMYDFAERLHERGIEVLIAGAGGAAHLPGMLAAISPLPVIGVPVSVTQLKGLDSLLSIVQMPKGVPVACVAIDNAFNAGLLAAQILGSRADDKKLQKKIIRFKKLMRSQVKAQKL
ncbi:MAG: 5-(carboxyamino)imidazole ribonucleotide mutase [Bdellovibrionota bacterium]